MNHQDPDTQCAEHGCARWRCDASHSTVAPATTKTTVGDLRVADRIMYAGSVAVVTEIHDYDPAGSYVFVGLIRHAGEQATRVRFPKVAAAYLIALVIALVAGCAVDAPPPTCASIGAPDILLCSHDGRCTWQGEACERGRSVGTPGTGSGSDGQMASPGDEPTCELLAAGADPACFEACADFAGFMAGVAPGTCRSVSCELSTGESKSIGACVDPK